MSFDLPANTECTQYVVRPCDAGGWTSCLKTRAAGPYVTREFALRVAIAEALQFRAGGGKVRITVQNARGTVGAERCLCDRLTPHDDAGS